MYQRPCVGGSCVGRILYLKTPGSYVEGTHCPLPHCTSNHHLADLHNLYVKMQVSPSFRRLGREILLMISLFSYCIKSFRFCFARSAKFLFSFFAMTPCLYHLRGDFKNPFKIIEKAVIVIVAANRSNRNREQ